MRRYLTFVIGMLIGFGFLYLVKKEPENWEFYFDAFWFSSCGYWICYLNFKLDKPIKK